MGIRNFLLHAFVQQGAAENVHGHNTQKTQVPINCDRFEEWEVHITLKRPSPLPLSGDDTQGYCNTM